MARFDGASANNESADCQEEAFRLNALTIPRPRSMPVWRCGERIVEIPATAPVFLIPATSARESGEQRAFWEVDGDLAKTTRRTASGWIIGKTRYSHQGDSSNDPANGAGGFFFVQERLTLHFW
jgi:hypothetical protein